jgi:hypothetical protein
MAIQFFAIDLSELLRTLPQDNDITDIQGAGLYVFNMAPGFCSQKAGFCFLTSHVIFLSLPGLYSDLSLHPGPWRVNIDHEIFSTTHHHTLGPSTQGKSAAQRGILASGWIPRPTTLSGRMPAIV